jgi:glycosyltransferase involved in cell wall biosynthesis
MVVIEAMDLGRPVIATSGGGPSEVITSDQEGILTPPDDPHALAREMVRLADDAQLRSLIGARGAARVRADFRTEVGAATLIRHLDALQ